MLPSSNSRLWKWTTREQWDGFYDTGRPDILCTVHAFIQNFRQWMIPEILRRHPKTFYIGPASPLWGKERDTFNPLTTQAITRNRNTPSSYLYAPCADTPAIFADYSNVQVAWAPSRARLCHSHQQACKNTGILALSLLVIL